jgi:hypothetical protein
MGRPKQLPPAAPTGQKQITGFFGGQKRAADSNEDLHVDKRKCQDTQTNTGELAGCSGQQSTTTLCWVVVEWVVGGCNCWVL